MTAQLGLFPLNLVVYPFEDLNLHVFEPRYRQLVADCMETGEPFGVPAYIDDEVKNYGGAVEIVEITNTYDDGRLDIKTRGTKVFMLENMQNPMSAKLYAGGTALFQELKDDSNYSERFLLTEKARQLYDIMGVEMDVDPNDEFLSYKVAHRVGMSLLQEYQLLTIPQESTRVNFLLEHLVRTIPYLKEVERTKERIKMNGHFKRFNPLDF